MARSRSLRFLWTVLLAFPAWAGAQQSQPGPTVTWEPVPLNQIFPAALLSTVGVSKRPQNSHVLCEPHSFARIRVKSSAPQTHVHVEVRVDGFSEVSSCDATLENADQQYLIAPTIRWDTVKLAAVDQPLPTTVVFNLRANGADLGEKTTHLQVRAVNDVPYRTTDPEGNVRDQSNLFAAFVNENSPVVEVILKEALQWGAVGQFLGYQRSAEDVRMQVFAVWNVLQRHNVKYSSITTPSGFSENVQSQSVRFASEAFQANQANCVDGSVLFASVLYKIGILPVLVKLPGHMFVGYYLNPQSHGTLNNLEFLETTMLGSGPPVVLRDEPFPHHDRQWLESTISYKEFAAAVAAGNKRFQSEVSPKLREKDPRYKIIGIKKAREDGINPIPR